MFYNLYAIKRLLNHAVISVLVLSSFLLVSSPGISSALECVNVKTLFSIKGGYDQPSDLAVGPNGYIYVVDGVNNRIVVVDKKGRYKFAFGSWGAGA